MIKGLMHIGVYTLSLEKSICFYRDILGFDVRWRGLVSHQTGQLPVATLALGDCVIELVQPAEPARVHTEEGPVQHIALHVTELEQVIDGLLQKGLKLEEEITEIDYEGGVRHCFVRGPSHERIELGEYITSA